MNRRERRRLEREGKLVRNEPAYSIKPSEMVESTLRGPGQEAMNKEINRQLLEADKKYALDLDSMVLWAIRQFAGWGPKKMKEFYLFMFKEHLRMREFYSMNSTYPERYKLKEKGIDVEAWYNALFNEKGEYKNLDEVSL